VSAITMDASRAAERAVSASPRTSFAGHIAEFDGFRGFGVWCVFLAHFFPEATSGAVRDLFQVSWLLMDGFFVLSGFLIVGTLLDSRERPDYYRRFFLRRSLRIFPAYYAVIAVLIALVFASGRGPRFAAEWGSPFWFLSYMGNLPSGLGGRWPPVESFVPLWSLQIEEQFYLLSPFAARSLSLVNFRRLLWGLVIFSPLLRFVIYLWVPENTHAQYTLLPCRFEGFALGALMALRFRTGRWDLPGKGLTLATVGLLVGTVVVAIQAGINWSAPFNRTIGFLLASAAWAFAFVWMIRNRGSRKSAFLRWGPVQYCGKVSYGIYLMHSPASTAVAQAFNRVGWHPDPLVVLLVQAAFTLCCATASWYLLERPILALKRRFERTRAVVAPQPS
jgi:peptidoglycan/LPS O-acetylase OafA/YrhL